MNRKFTVMEYDYLALGRQVLAAQSFSALLGAEMTAMAPGEAVIELPIKAEFLQQFGVVHGGVISYLADNALTFAGGSRLGPSVLTSEYKINFVKAARGERLIARATVAAASMRQAVCRCDIVAVASGQEYLCATAQGTILTLCRRESGRFFPRRSVTATSGRGILACASNMPHVRADYASPAYRVTILRV